MTRQLLSSVLALTFTATAHAGMPLKILFLGDSGPHRPAQRFRLIEPVLSQRGVEVVYADTAKALYAIYFALSLACYLAYRWAGMTWSDAFLHMCSTVALGGFSSHDASFSHWNSPLIEGTAVFFMTLAGFNFSMHFLAWRRRSLRAYVSDPESKAYVATLVAACLAIGAFLLARGVYPDWSTALRYATFNVVFFRRRNLFASFLLYFPYAAIAVALFLQLLALEPVAAAAFAPYLAYFVYATAWGYAIWRLNPVS